MFAALGGIRESERAHDSGTGASGAEGQSGNDSGVPSLHSSKSRTHGHAEGTMAYDYWKSRFDTGENESISSVLKSELNFFFFLRQSTRGIFDIFVSVVF